MLNFYTIASSARHFCRNPNCTSHLGNFRLFGIDQSIAVPIQILIKCTHELTELIDRSVRNRLWMVSFGRIVAFAIAHPTCRTPEPTKTPVSADETQKIRQQLNKHTSSIREKTRP